ncbi:Fic family protein [Aestuariimicrobium ganziense]|uniref:Fic family protein n=1 Tax=Aestuariimicrobium ganziense TaxID=2773677 RepID=UPI001940F992|nr:Fic family protein [Aestuariimicrobium ganziense]
MSTDLEASRATPSPCPVPPVGTQDAYWVADNDGTASRAAMAAASGPYSTTVPARLSDLDLRVPSDLAAAAEDAASALARFDSQATARLGAEGSLGPMKAILLRTEASSSSQIENLTVGARQLALAEIGQSVSLNARLVIGNVRAMMAANTLATRLDEQSILDMHRALMEGHHDEAGQYRGQLVWVGTSGISPRGAVHVAPAAALVPDAMADLVQFVTREDVQVVVQTAVAHAQLETIHPFADGNGRTGRALVHAMMRAKGLVTSVTAPVSAGLLTDTTTYFDALQAFRAGDARPIVERFCEAAMFAAASGTRLVDQLAEEVTASMELLAATRLRRQAGAWRVLPRLVGQPIVNAAWLQQSLDMNAVGAQRALRQLVDAGVVVERTGFQRNRVWEHRGILAILDGWAASIRRR